MAKHADDDLITFSDESAVASSPTAVRTLPKVLGKESNDDGKFAMQSQGQKNNSTPTSDKFGELFNYLRTTKAPFSTPPTTPKPHITPVTPFATTPKVASSNERPRLNLRTDATHEMTPKVVENIKTTDEYLGGLSARTQKPVIPKPLPVLSLPPKPAPAEMKVTRLTKAHIQRLERETNPHQSETRKHVEQIDRAMAALEGTYDEAEMQKLEDMLATIYSATDTGDDEEHAQGQHAKELKGNGLLRQQPNALVPSANGTWSKQSRAVYLAANDHYSKQHNALIPAQPQRSLQIQDHNEPMEQIPASHWRNIMRQRSQHLEKIKQLEEELEEAKSAYTKALPEPQHQPVNFDLFGLGVTTQIAEQKQQIDDLSRALEGHRIHNETCNQAFLKAKLEKQDKIIHSLKQPNRLKLVDQGEVSEQNKQIAELKEEINALTLELERQRAHTSKLEEQIKLINRLNHEAKQGEAAQIAEQKKQIGDLKQELERVHIENCDEAFAIAQLEEKDKLIERLKEAIQAEKSQNNFLTAQLKSQEPSNGADSRQHILKLQEQLKAETAKCGRLRNDLRTAQKMLENKSAQLDNLIRQQAEGSLLRGASHLVFPSPDSKLPKTVLGCIECYVKNVTCDNMAVCQNCIDSHARCRRFRCSQQHIFKKLCPDYPACRFRHNREGWLVSEHERPEW